LESVRKNNNISNTKKGLFEDPVTMGGKGNTRGRREKIQSTPQHFWNFDGAQ
jgi:hypothetical protein